LKAQKDTVNVIDIFNLSLEELMNLEVYGPSRYKQKVADIPNSIQVVYHQQIVERGYYDLSDLLKDVQGFDISENAGRFGEYYSLRGIGGNDRFLILINGHKLNPASGTFISVGNSIAIFNAKRVEIIYGTVSAVYGADAFSGIINIVFEKNAPIKKTSVSAYANYGSMNTFDAAFNISSGINDNLSLNFNARIYTSDGFDVLGTDSIYNIINNYQAPITNKCEQPISDHNVYFNLNYKKFSFNYYRQQFNEGNALGHNPAIYIYDKTNKWKTSTDIFWLTYSNSFNDNDKLSLDISYKYHIQDDNTLFHKWIVPNVIAESFKQYMTGKDKTVLAVFTYNNIISEKFQFIAGIDNEYTSSIPPYANDEILGNSYKYEGAYAEMIDNLLTIRENRVSGFGQIIYSPFQFVDFVLGARYDYSSRFKGVFNPRLGLILTPSKTTKIKFIYGKAFQAPSLFYQYEQFGTPIIAMLSTSEVQNYNANWNLENQIVNTLEFSLIQKIKKNYEFKINVFHSNLQNLIERSLFSADSVYNKYFDSYTNGLRNENIGKQNITGGNFTFNANISKKVLLYSFYTYTNVNVVASGNGLISEVPRIAEHKIWAGITVKDIFKYLTFSSRLRWSSKMYNANRIVFADNIQDGYFSLDVNASLNNLNDNFRIYAAFNNILNQKYHAGLFDQRGVYTAVIPHAGFTFNVGIEFFFNK